MRRRALNAAVGGAALLLATGCAHPLRASAPQEAFWSGRLALQVEAGQSFAALFELRGSPRQGELMLLSPLGSALAQLAWAPGEATLRSGGQTQQFASVDELAERATGAAIPVAALFDWLAGVQRPVPGWQADLSDLSNGRLRAQRFSPEPRADLRIALER